nr:hypothetical protein [Saccharopolyspora sp. HNM0983]
MLDELRELLDTISGRAEDYLRACASAEGDEPPGGCGWCPVCAAVALLGGQRSEAAERLVQQLVAAVRALRGLLAEQAAGSAPTGEPTAGPAGAPTEPRAERVQPIDVRRVDGRVLDGAEANRRC